MNSFTHQYPVKQDFGGIIPNRPYARVRENTRLVREHKIGFISPVKPSPYRRYPTRTSGTLGTSIAGDRVRSRTFSMVQGSQDAMQSRPRMYSQRLTNMQLLPDTCRILSFSTRHYTKAFLHFR